MNIDDMTFGQLKNITNMFNGKGNQPDILAHLIGEKVVVRDDKAGVIVCVLEDVRGTQWRGTAGRKIHYWEKAGAVEGIAATGVCLSESRITERSDECNGQHLVQINKLSDAVYDSIMGASVWNPK